MAASPSSVGNSEPRSFLSGRPDEIDASVHTASRAAAPPARSRLESLDATRAAFVLLGVVFHASLPYHSGDAWLVDDPSDSTALTWLATFLHSFRMPGFFLIAGLLSELAFRDATRVEFLWRRVLRLGVPMVLALGTVNVLQYELLAHFRATACAGTGPCVAPDPRASIGLGHLWFLAVLLAATIIYWLVRTPFAQSIDRVVRGIAPVHGGLRGTLALLVFAAAYAGWEIASLVLQKIPGLGTDFFGFSVGALLYGLFFFMAGVVVARAPALLQCIQSVPSRRAVAGLLLAGLFLLAAAEQLSGASSLAGRLGEVTLRAAATVVNVVAAIYVSTQVFRRFASSMRFLASYSYPVYLVHQCLVVGAALVVASSPVPALVKFVVVITFALAMAFLISLVLDKSPAWAHRAVGGRPRTAGSAISTRAFHRDGDAPSAGSRPGLTAGDVSAISATPLAHGARRGRQPVQ